MLTPVQYKEKSISKMENQQINIIFPKSFQKHVHVNLWHGNSNSTLKCRELSFEDLHYKKPDTNKPSFKIKIDMADAINVFKQSVSDLGSVLGLYTDLINLKATGKLLEESPKLFTSYLEGKEGRSITYHEPDGLTIEGMTPLLKDTRKDLKYALDLYIKKNETLLFQDRDVFILLLALTLDAFYMKSKEDTKKVDNAFIFIALMNFLNSDKKLDSYLCDEVDEDEEWDTEGFEPLVQNHSTPSPEPVAPATAPEPAPEPAPVAPVATSADEDDDAPDNWDD